jgi:hypothetical protein
VASKFTTIVCIVILRTKPPPVNLTG